MHRNAARAKPLRELLFAKARGKLGQRPRITSIMADLPDDIARINALTTNARTTWFVLLGVLVFVGITLMSVQHIDFYGVDRATKLPLVDVAVPTPFFFIAAPLLIAAVYGYFHLYLIRLWDALSAAAPRHEGRPLGDTIAPWLVTDAALHLRRWLRPGEPPCTTPRTLEGADLSGAQMEGANLRFALLTGLPTEISLLDRTDLRAAINHGGALRFVDLTSVLFDPHTDFRNAFLDGSVVTTDAFARQMGGDLNRPCQWWPEPIKDDAEFFGRWRGWIAANPDQTILTSWGFIAPAPWRDVTPIPPPEGCDWQTGPMPGAENERSFPLLPRGEAVYPDL